MKFVFVVMIALMAGPVLLPASARTYSNPNHKPHKVKRHKGVKHHNS